MYYLTVFWFGFMLVAGLIIGRKFFFGLIERTTSLLDAMLSDDDDDVKQRLLIQRLTRLVKVLAQLIAAVAVIILISVLPGYLFVELNHIPAETLDFDSWKFYVVLIGSSTIPFLGVGFISKKTDYSEWSILFHRIMFNNPNLSKGVFGLEKSFFKKKTKDTSDDFLIISGLARAGTTALTTLLHDTRQFHSLSYANMPLLLSPNLWRVFYKPKNDELRERSHGDKVMFGYNTVEALEEFFWAVHLKNSYVTTTSLKRHDIGPEVYDQYILYQNLLRADVPGTTKYIAKNNNFILRYESMRKLNKKFVMVILFRDPLEHAFSLLNQHNRYRKFQQEDSFVREYMNWLGHFEFGLNHKYFDFTSPEVIKAYDENTIDYWLRIWIDYYSYILTLPPDENFILLEYQDFLSNPVGVVKTLGKRLKIELRTDNIKLFENQKSISFDGNLTLRDEAYDIHKKLVATKIKI